MTSKFVKRLAFLVSSISLCALIIVSFFRGDLWSTCYTYVDIVNGTTKTVLVLFGRNYKERTNYTSFSVLVTRLKLQKTPDWRKAVQSERGLRRWFFPQTISFDAARTLNAMRQFSQLVEMGVIDNPTDKITHIQDLAKDSGGKLTEEYVTSLSVSTR